MATRKVILEAEMAGTKMGTMGVAVRTGVGRRNPRRRNWKEEGKDDELKRVDQIVLIQQRC